MTTILAVVSLGLAPYELAVQRIWGFGRRGDDAVLAAAAQRFSQLRASDGVEATVYARAADSVQDGVANQATRALNERTTSTRPWLHIGSVATSSSDDVLRAVHAQRALLIETARGLHKSLRFLPTLSLAYADGGELICEPERRLGSYRCASCGTLVPAGNGRCVCGEAREVAARTGTSPQVASVRLPSGMLTLAVAPKRQAPLPLECCGFVARADADEAPRGESAPTSRPTSQTKTPRGSGVSMRANQKKPTGGVSRRDVLDGSSLTKRFYDPAGWRSKLPPGWSPALVLSIGALAAKYGSSVREGLFDELRAFGGGATNQGDVAHVPLVSLSPGRSRGQVSVEVTAPSSGDAVDYIWLTDAGSREILSGRKMRPSEAPRLAVLVERGRRVVPSVHCKRDGVWEGEAIVADP